MKKLFVLLATVSVFYLIVTQTDLGAVLRTGNVKQIAQYIQSFGLLSIGISALIVVLQTFFPFVPYVLLCGLNMLVFGPFAGFLITWLSATLGASLSFFLSRYIAQDWAKRKVAHLPFFQKIYGQARSSGFRIILMARLIPVIPSGVINMAAGLSEIRYGHFLLATLIGKAPITLLEGIIGHDLFNFQEHKLRIIVVAAALGIIMWAGMRISKAMEGSPSSPPDSRKGR